MSDQLTNALLAIALGSVAAVLLLVPVAAVQYRLDGRLGPVDLLVLVSAAVYVLALWTYTLLPVPAAGDYTCQGEQLQLLGSVRDIAWDGSALGLLRDPGFLQIALNVLLFVPLGWFVRVIAHRGVLVSTLAGFAVSLLIESTQRTGVWGLYRCPYRLFDVDDLLVNTIGATIGGLLALLLVRRRHPDRVMPTRITLGRRLVGMFADVFAVGVVSAAAALAYRGYHLYVARDGIAGVDRTVQSAWMWGAALAVEALAVLLAGRTVGEWVVSTRAVARRPGRTAYARVVKLATGVAPLFVLAALPGPYDLVLVPAYAVATVVAALRGRDHRGLSHTLAGMDLEVVDPRVRTSGRR